MSEQKLVPEVRFPEFEGEWDTGCLNDVAKLERGKFTPRPRNDPRFYNGSMPFVQTGDIARSNKYLSTYTQTLNDEGVKVSKVFSPDTILVSIAANVGDVALASFNVACPDSLVGIQAAKTTSPEWLYYQLSTRKQELLSYATTNAQANINLEVLRPLKLNYPTLNEQQKIADFLSSMDAKLAKLDRKKTLLEDYKRGLMQQIFSQKIRFKQDDGSEFPEWEKVLLGNLFTERSEKSDGDNELLSVTMNEGVVKRSDIGQKDSSSEDKSNYKKVYAGDIAYNSMRMWQGASGLSNYDGIVSPAYTVVTPISSVFPMFFAYFFKYQPVINLFRRYSQGLTSDTWNLKFPAFSKIIVFIPESKEEQQKIADFLSSFDQKIDVVAKQIGQLETFKKGLLQKLFV